MAGVEPQVPEMDWREGVRRPLRALEFTGDHACGASASIEGNGWNLPAQDLVVLGCRHLVLGWQVDPELDDLKDPAGARKLSAVEFLMDDARGCGHPLHVARSD